MLFDGDFTLTDQIVDNHECKRENLIGMMQDVQEHYKYLPPEVRRIAKMLSPSLAR